MRSVDEALMARAIELSQRGFPAPNPRVGCVLVRDGEVVGEGWCPKDGGVHAEAMALEQAGQRAKGSTAYVTLEPCAHDGRTPSCAKALVREGVAKAVIAVRDPHSLAAGGTHLLAASGIEVVEGVLASEAAWINRQFLFAVHTGRPYVSLKAATTLDGFVARPDGTSKWITGPEARQEGHRLRAERGAVLLGRRTVEEDHPLLTARIDDVLRQPTRAILDPQGRLDPHEVCLMAPEGMWITGVPREGSVVLPVTEGRFAPQDILAALSGRGERGVLIEGGAHTLRIFLEANLAQEIHHFIAPAAWGEGQTWTGGWQGRLPELGFETEGPLPRGDDFWWAWTKKSDVMGTILPLSHS